MENLEIINVIQGPSSLRRLYTDRPSHALVFKRNSASHYTFSNTNITLATGDVLFIPQGATYTVCRATEEPSEYILINFHANIPNPRPTLYTPSGSVDWDRKLQRFRLLNTVADRHRLYALFYELLSCICASSADYRSSEALTQLAPALAYLKENMFDPELKIGDLHSLCGISDTYFRKLFIASHGLPPKKHILLQRLRHAKAILENGEFNSIGEVALLCGFEDSLYFSKAFKNRFGYPPSKAIPQNAKSTQAPL